MTYDEEEYIDLGKYFTRLRNHWKTLVLWTAAAFAAGCVFAVFTPRKYTVVSELAPELSSTATNRLSSLASLAGMTSTILGTTDAVYPMVYPEILKSAAFTSDLFTLPVEVKTKKDETIQTDLYDYMLNYQHFSPIGAVMSLPSVVLGWIKGIFTKDEQEEEGEGVDPFYLTKEQGLVVRALQKSIVPSIDKKTMLLTITTTMQDRVICAQVAKAVNDNLRKYVTKYRTDKAVHDCEYYTALNEQAREEYYAAQQAYSRYVDAHQGVTLHSFMVESDRLKNESALKYQLYNSTSQQLQNARAKVQLETPVFAEIVPPSVPQKSSNSRKTMALAFAFLGIISGAVYVLIKNLF